MLVEKVFGSKAKLALLRVFNQNPQNEFALGDLQKIMNRSTGTIYPALEELIKARIVLSRKAGRSNLYKLNFQNKLVSKMNEIFKAEETLLIDAANQFAKQLNKQGIISITLFGSVAKNKATSESDVDILIISNHKSIKQGVDKLVDKFLEQDIIISPMIYSVKEIQKMKKEFNSFIISVEEEGKVLYGKNLKKI